MFRRGNRLFTASTLLLLVIAAAHTLGHFSPIPEDPELEKTLAAMHSYRMEVGLGMRPSIYDVQTALSLTMSLLLVLWAAQNLLVVGLYPEARPLHRAVASVSALFSALLALLYARYQIAPPMTLFAVATLLFALTGLLGRERSA